MILHKRLLESHIKYLLFKNEKNYLKFMRLKNVRDIPPFIVVGSNATTHFVINNFETMCVICIRPDIHLTRLEIDALIVHEAVHIWQEINLKYKASGEVEAYAIQAITLQLLEDFYE